MDLYQTEETRTTTPEETRLLKKLFKWSLRIFLAVFAIVFLVLASLLVRLSFSPIDLDFARPHVAKALEDADMDTEVQFGAIQMVWTRWLRPFEIVVKDIKVTDVTAGTDSLTIPEVGMSFWFSRLLAGHVDLRSLYIYSPKLSLNRNPEKGFYVKLNGDGESEPLTYDEIREMLLLDNGQKELGSLSSLRKIKIVDAKVVLHDDYVGEVWKLPKTTFTVHRYEDGFRLQTTMKPRETSFFAGSLDAELKHRVGSSQIDLSLTFDRVNLSELVRENKELFEEDDIEESRFEEVLEFLHGLNFPLKGFCHLAVVPQTGQIIHGEFELNAGRGKLNWAGQDVPMNEFYLKAEASPHMIELRQAELGLFESEFQATGKFESPESLLLIQELGQPGATLTVSLEGEDIKIESLDKLWPAWAAPGAQKWVTEEVPFGLMPTVVGRYEGHIDEDHNMIADQVDGNMELDNLSINYFEGLPLVKGVSGSAKFNLKEFNIVVASGHVENVGILGGEIKITGLETGDEKMALDLNLAGPLPDVLDIINHEPLEYAKEAHLDPKRTRGEGSVNLKMNFPLLEDLQLDDIKIDVKADYKQVGIDIDVGDFPIRFKGGGLQIVVDETHLEVNGQGILNELDSKLNVLLYFGNPRPQPWESQVIVEATASAEDFKRLGYDYTSFITGKAQTKLTFQVLDTAKSSLAFNLDLGAMKIDVPQIGWHKKQGTAATLAFVTEIEKGTFKKIKNINLQSPYIQAKGQGDFNSKGGVHAIYLTSVKAPHTFAAMSMIRPQSGGYELHFNGKQINAEPFMDYIETADSTEKNTETIPIKVTSNVDVLRMGEGRDFKDVQSKVELDLEPDDVKWRLVHLSATAGKGLSSKGAMGDKEGGITFDLETVDGDQQTLEIRANDAGQLFKNLKLYDNVTGGNLVVKAARSLSQPFAGSFKLKEFDGTDIPLAGRLAAVLSPAGIMNLFSSSDKLYINEFKCDFTFSEREVTFAKGIGKSIGLGFTAQGKMDRLQRRFDVKGNIIPAYVLNSILDNIPIVGSLLTGGKGEGLFAVEYTVKGPFDDPQVNVNPMTALAPGFIRGLFGD